MAILMILVTITTMVAVMRLLHTKQEATIAPMYTFNADLHATQEMNRRVYQW